MPNTDERGIVSKSKLTALATAIKDKAGLSGGMTLDELTEAVGDIGGGGIIPSGTVQIEENGTVDVSSYEFATVNVVSKFLTAKVVTGEVTTPSSGNSISIPLGGITNVLYLAAAYEDYITDFSNLAENTIVGCQYAKDNCKLGNAVIRAGIAANVMYVGGSTQPYYYSSGTTISITGGAMKFVCTRGVSSAGLKFKYIVIGE